MQQVLRKYKLTDVHTSLDSNDLSTTAARQKGTRQQSMMMSSTADNNFGGKLPVLGGASTQIAFLSASSDERRAIVNRYAKQGHQQREQQIVVKDKEEELLPTEVQVNQMSPVLSVSPGRNNSSSRKLQKLNIKNLKQFPDGIRDKIVVSQISVRES